jgi:hypothetical protein
MAALDAHIRRSLEPNLDRLGYSRDSFYRFGDALSVLGRGHPAHRDRSFFILGVCGGRFGAWRRRTTALRE